MGDEHVGDKVERCRLHARTNRRRNVQCVSNIHHPSEERVDMNLNDLFNILLTAFVPALIGGLCWWVLTRPPYKGGE